MPHQHPAVYPYQDSSNDPAPSPLQTYVTRSTLPIFPHVPVSPSPSHLLPLTTPRVSSASPGEAQGPTLYPSVDTYSPVGYATSPPFVYPPTSFVPPLSIYGPHYPPPHYAHSYSSPSKHENQAVSWYFPPGVTSLSPFNRPSIVPRHEDERAAQVRIATPPSNPSPTGKPRSQSHFGGPSDPRTETTPSTSTSQAKTQTGENPPSSESTHASHQERRSYHPKSPAQRSDWVMWAGNVPSDATPHELLDFFNQPSPSESSSPSEQSTKLQDVDGGVFSVFLIARSNCAFVNFESEAQLRAAIARFHGQPIRPDDSRCPRLVCRVRQRTDDLNAGVGAQRGSGMHVKWIKEQRARVRRERPHSSGLPEAIVKSSSPSSPSDDRGRSVSPCSILSDSLASTDSSILSRYLPQRYFILKSRTQYDLDLSVQRNVWATQQHNEELLDQAYRTSKDVFLIFSANKSGEFYGYARMTGPIFQDDKRERWGSRPETPTSFAWCFAVSDAKGDIPVSPRETVEKDYDFPPEEHRTVEQSPRSISDSHEGVSFVKPHVSSAPAELRESHGLTPSVQHTSIGPPLASVPLKSQSFELNTDAPLSAIRETLGRNIRQSVQPVISGPSRECSEVRGSAPDSALKPSAEESTKENDALEDILEQGRGRSFHVDWIRTERLPFFRTRHLRNPWNHGREVKVSRDGTELEPNIGRELLEEWDKPPPSPADVPAASSRMVPRRRGPRSTSHVP
ncbi:YT521-B-like domain-containing protein [Russula earlei]|uniref:YT521-B-like domain-containing protein n=1 Tax=Russula earlei TaxID=71964 RepID=A0ACC0U8X6_9AGAM|nr:YT521-B-like domain-containing protein [Russula earlei]